MRKLPYTEPQLWKMTPQKLKEITVTQNVISLDEQHAIERQQLARKGFRLSRIPAPTFAQLSAHLKLMGLPYSRLTRDGLIDRIMSAPSRPAFLELDEDQKALVCRIGEPEILVSAGPGSGKTLTCGRFASDALRKLSSGITPTRILVLVYSRAAKSSFSNVADAKKIPKTKMLSEKVGGIAIVTFHEFAYQLSRSLKKVPPPSLQEDDDSYRRCLESGVKVCQRGKHSALRYWSQVIVDEAQDLTNDHWSIVDAVVMNSPGCKLLVAGDPRQSLYEGADQFVKRWLAAKPSEKAHLRYNHRSAKTIVETINLFSKANFPSGIHEDQIPVSSEIGNVSFVETDSPAHAIANCFIESVNYDVYAVAPITTERWGLQKVILQLRNEVFIRTSSNPTRIDSNNKNEPGKYYGYATAKKIKGTERRSVVVFGIEQDYCFGGIPRSTQMSAMFVALSRARHTLIIVKGTALGHSNSSVTLASLNALSPPWRLVESKHPKPRLTLHSNSLRVSSSQTSDLGAEKGLAGVHFPVSRTPLDQQLPAVKVDISNDEDFVGCYVEAMVAQGLGADLGRREVAVEFINNSKNECRSRPHEFGICKREETNQMCIICCCPYKDKTVSDIKKAASQYEDRAYAVVFLKYSVICQKPWKPSSRLANEKELNSIPDLAKHLINVVFGGEVRSIVYLRRISMDIKSPRCPCTNAIPHSEVDFGINVLPVQPQRVSTSTDIKYINSNMDTSSPRCSCPNTILTGEVDLVINDIPVELKHTSSITNTHRRQAAIYAEMMGCQRALLVNTKLGQAEWVKLRCTQSELFAAARCMSLFRYGKSLAIPNESRLLQAPAKHNINCEVFIDVETDSFNGCEGTGYITELSAIAVIDGNVHSAFTEIPHGVKPVHEFNFPERTQAEECWASKRAQEVTNLKVVNLRELKNDQDGILRRFCDWVNQVSSNPCFVHWGGGEKDLLARLGFKNTTDALQVFRAYSRITSLSCKLESAVERVLGPEQLFEPHRSSEDVAATAALWMAMVRRGVYFERKREANGDTSLHASTSKRFKHGQ